MKRHRDFFRVALVGYTSAGKTTLLNVLTKSKLKESPELFTTLDTLHERHIHRWKNHFDL